MLQFSFRNLLLFVTLAGVCFGIFLIANGRKRSRSLMRQESSLMYELERLKSKLALVITASRANLPSNSTAETCDHLLKAMPRAKFSTGQIDRIGKMDHAETLAFWTNGQAYKMSGQTIPDFCIDSRFKMVDRDNDGFREYVSRDGNVYEWWDTWLQVKCEATGRFVKLDTRDLHKARKASPVSN